MNKGGFKWWGKRPLSKELQGLDMKGRLHRIIFKADTPEGKAFDVALLAFILMSILLVIFDSLRLVPAEYNWILQVLEWLITFFFTIEYALRVYCSRNRKRYIFSFYGIIDLISTLPLYLGFFFQGALYLLILRSFRLIRVFRVFGLLSFITEGNLLLNALKESKRKIFVFFLFVLVLTISIGTLMYIIEGGSGTPGFDNILSSIYWTIVTLTSVGYGDITPMTPLGRFLSAMVMLLGYTIIAVPTGVVSVSMMQHSGEKQRCGNCGKGNDTDAIYCKYCGRVMRVDEDDDDD